ncbi:hypothetical protein [Paenibacillus methanolicus]|uniref:Uncharacterized protein n=1 Tax=Paenibacillus methanolicus TaxID=582686 RepID=A0A5S5CDV9_9BACL|nr:hypothetical protein [Paenibacillus methanolicus]TYP77544.1 hypothetical protein BCM02_102104 [Paenibacillus methanolicus]
MNKTMIVASAAAVLIAATVICAQAETDGESGASLEPRPKISKRDYERMAPIVAAVNAGRLPIAALQAARPLIDASPRPLSEERAVDARESGYGQTP